MEPGFALGQQLLGARETRDGEQWWDDIESSLGEPLVNLGFISSSSEMGVATPTLLQYDTPPGIRRQPV